MVCDCGSIRISTLMDVGDDVDPSDEERQHLDTCLDCGKSRLWVHRWSFDGGKDGGPLDDPKVYWGKWQDNEYGFPG